MAFSASAARAYDGEACTYGQNVEVVTCSLGTSFFISGRKTKSTPSFDASDATWPRNPLAGKQNSAPLMRLPRSRTACVVPPDRRIRNPRRLKNRRQSGR